MVQHFYKFIYILEERDEFALVLPVAILQSAEHARLHPGFHLAELFMVAIIQDKQNFDFRPCRQCDDIESVPEKPVKPETLLS